MAPEPVRIAFCITDLDPGGAERALVQLVTRLERNCWQPSVFSLAGPGLLADELERAEIPVTCLGARRAWHVSVMPRLARKLRACHPALLQTWLYHANIAGRIAGRWAGVPKIVSGIRVAEKRSRARLWIDRATDRMVDCHICVSRDVAEFSIRQGGLPARKVVVVPNGVDAQRFAKAASANLAEFGIPPHSRMLLFVGRLDPQKGPSVLLEAAASLIGRYHDLHVLLAGVGPLRASLEQRVRALGLERRVHLAGWRDDVPALLRASVGLVLPSLWEGMPNVVLEAMAAGRPVVATAAEGVADLVRDGETGVVVPPGSAEALAAGLKRLLDDPQLAAAWGRVAQDIVRHKFTWDALVARHEAVYRALLENRPAGIPPMGPPKFF